MDGWSAEVRRLLFKSFDAAEAAKWPPAKEPAWIKITQEEYSNLMDCKLRLLRLVKACWRHGVWNHPGSMILMAAFNPPGEKNVAEVVK